MIEYSCFNYDGDEDCHKCAAYGYIFGCPNPCQEYQGLGPQIDPYADIPICTKASPASRGIYQKEAEEET